MSTAGMVLAIFSVFGMLVGMVPFCGWVNWFNIPVAFIALLLSVAGMITGSGGRNQALAGIILAVAAIGFGGIRWIMGGLIF
jgi:hypothetical protein